MRNISIAILMIILFGALYRMWPILFGMPTLSTFFVTEDGYLMLTVARNMAVGNGMTVSNGLIETNGIQPLMTFIFSAIFYVASGDKVAGLAGVHLVHTVIALVCVFAIRSFSVLSLLPRDNLRIIHWSVPLLWFLGPLILRHSMNGLETSLYTLFVLLVMLVFHKVISTPHEKSIGRDLLLGTVCGLAVLARNDAVFLVFSIFSVWAIWEFSVERSSLVSTCLRLTPPGLLSIAVASPWLVNNYVRFGSIVPISGTAQSIDASFGENLPLIPSKLFESAFPMIPIPSQFELVGIVSITALAATLFVLWILLWRTFSYGDPTVRAVVLAYFLFGLLLSAYYALFFGAGHFLSRYLAPLTPLLILASVAASVEVGRFLFPRRMYDLSFAYIFGGFSLSLALLVRALLPGVTQQGHEQVVSWVSDNVPEEAWVGAIQTGTLGYWHDRTVNLDGKVNPKALEAKQRDGHVLGYVVDSEIDYLVDWVGIGNWIRSENGRESGFSAEFELLLKDSRKNLAALKRIQLRLQQ